MDGGDVGRRGVRVLPFAGYAHPEDFADHFWGGAFVEGGPGVVEAFAILVVVGFVFCGGGLGCEVGGVGDDGVED